MSHSTQQNKTDTESQVELLPAVANYLQVLNEQVLPAFIQTGSVPNAINAREGLANLTHTFVTETVDMALIVDDIIDCDAPTGDAYDVPAYDVPVRLFYPSLPSDAANQTELTPFPVMLYFHGGGGTLHGTRGQRQMPVLLGNHLDFDIEAVLLEDPGLVRKRQWREACPSRHAQDDLGLLSRCMLCSRRQNSCG